MRTYGLAVLLGGAVGLLSAVYLRGVTFLQHLLWDGQESRLPLEPRLAVILTCVLGGALVGVLRHRHDRDTPHDLEDALLQLDHVVSADDDEPQHPPSVTWLLRAALLGVVSLAAGASLGPEAPLLVLATGFAQRMARILRTTQQEAAYISAAGALSGLFGGPFGAVVLPVERSRSPGRVARLVGPGTVAAVAGLVALLLALPGEGGLRYDLPDVSSGVGAAIGWSAAAGLLGTTAGLALLAGIGPSRVLAQRWITSTVVRASVGGLVLGVCGALAPLTLFSGEHQAQTLIDEAAGLSIGLLLAVVALKIVATLSCIATGWFGGQIFPGAFVGMAAGLLVHAVTPSAPVAVLVAAGAGAGTTALLRRPLASTLVMLFFFPGTLVVPLLVGAGIAAVTVSALGDRLPTPARPGTVH